MSESSAGNSSDNALQKSTMPALFANAILCKKCLQMSQRATQHGKGPWLNAEQLLVPKAWCAGDKHQQCPGTVTGRGSQGPFIGSLHQKPWKCHFAFQSVRKAVWWHSKGCLGTEERTELCGLTEGDRPKLAGHRTQTLLPKQQTPKSALPAGAAFVIQCWSGSSTLPHFRNSYKKSDFSMVCVVGKHLYPASPVNRIQAENVKLKSCSWTYTLNFHNWFVPGVICYKLCLSLSWLHVRFH